jgi:hypothetical protein
MAFHNGAGGARAAPKWSAIMNPIATQVDECVTKITDRWIYYTQTLKFKPEVKLSEIIDSFAAPVREFIRINYPIVYVAPPEMFWMILFNSIYKSQTHPSAEVNAAIIELNQKYGIK